MHLKHACLPISPPEQVIKTRHSISYGSMVRKGENEKNQRRTRRMPMATARAVAAVAT